MAFSNIKVGNLVRFNTSASRQFLDLFENFSDKEAKQLRSKVSSKTFAPSSFRCDRKSWFRLRGTAPDDLPVDRALEFTAMIGTACHAEIQRKLIALSKEINDPEEFEWISVEEYLSRFPISYKYTIVQSGYETQLEIQEPFPIKFACDGIIRFHGVYYLVEIKTSSLSSFNSLTDAKQHHVDQVLCYCAVLGLRNIMMIYQDRQYGTLKMYSYVVSASKCDEIIHRFYRVMDYVNSNIAPPALPQNDVFCTGCVYSKKCNEWGRKMYEPSY